MECPAICDKEKEFFHAGILWLEAKTFLDCEIITGFLNQKKAAQGGLNGSSAVKFLIANANKWDDGKAETRKKSGVYME